MGDLHGELGAAGGSVTRPDTTVGETTRPVWRALVWLGFLAPFFFITYLGSLEIVSWREHVPVLLFEWERHIPFLAWTVVPYWSIDLFYGLSLFLSLTRFELDRLGLRLLSAQMIAVTIFVVAPLKLTSTIPADTGMFAFFFGALEDIVGKPFNLAPSLHIALLVILWVHYARHIPKRWHIPLHIWASLIGVSVLTANQHHFFDVPTGAALGLFCLWLWPEGGRSPLASAKFTSDPKRWRLASFYMVGATLCALVAISFGGWFLWLLWPTLSLIMVAFAYAALDTAAFQKDEIGEMSLAAKWLYEPYLLGVKLNAAIWTRGLPATNEFAPGLSIGPRPRHPSAGSVIIDMCAELPGRGNGKDWISHSTLDLIVPEPVTIARAALSVETARKSGSPVQICCALGFSRSASVAVAWLVRYGGYASVDDAVTHLRRVRPQIVIHNAQRIAIKEATGSIATA